MAESLDKFSNMLKDRADKQIFCIYKSLINQDVQCKPVKQKIKYIEETYPDLIANQGKKEEEKKEEKQSKEKPYQVQLASKYMQLYKSAMKRDKDFNLTLQDVHKLLQQKVCYYTGVKFEAEGQFSRTVDRVDNSLGYVTGNVVACTLAANHAKEDLFERPSHELEVNIDFMCKVVKTVLEFRKNTEKNCE